MASILTTGQLDKKKLITRYRSTYKVILSVFLILLLAVVASCGDNDGDDSPSGDIGCRVSQTVSTGFGRTNTPSTRYVLDAASTHTYDHNGNPKRITSHSAEERSFDTRYIDVNTVTKFDDQDFLVHAEIDSFIKYRYSENSIKTTQDYIYEDERLIRIETKETRDGVKNYSTETYAYNSSGQVMKYAKSDGSYTELEYDGTTLSKITKTLSDGEIRVPKFEINSQGFLIHWVERFALNYYDYEYRYELDNDGQVLQAEKYQGTVREFRKKYTYDTNKNPNALLYARLKGHPYIPDGYPDPVYKNNITAAEITYGSSYTVVYTYGYNSSGYPIKSTATTTTSNGNTTVEVSYDYAWCAE